MQSREEGQWVRYKMMQSDYPRTPALVGQIYQVGTAAQNYILSIEDLNGYIYRRFAWETTVITEEEAFLAKLEHEVAQSG